MSYRLKNLEKILFYLLLFLLPTQLAFHFWPTWAFVFGIRIDYLAPAIYLTDVLTVLLLIIWFVNERSKILKFLAEYRFLIIALLIFAVMNTAFSISIFPSIYKWVKIAEYVLLGLYVSLETVKSEDKNINKYLFASLVFFSLIGVLQFWLGRTVGGSLYYLGERSFNTATPGIALIQILGQNFLRAYSTFPHPNALAGYLGVVALLVMSTKRTFSKTWVFGLLVVFAAFVLTFSLSALVGLIFCLTIYLCYRFTNLKLINVVLLTAPLLLISLSLPYVSKYFIQSNIGLSESIHQRLELSLSAGQAITQNFFFGEGLNTFIVGVPKTAEPGFYHWLLQPVHNIYLLVFSELGMVGLVAFYVLLSKSVLGALKDGKTGVLLALIFIMTTGLFDHYWLTLQQNTLLLTFLIGRSFRKS